MVVILTERWGWMQRNTWCSRCMVPQGSSLPIRKFWESVKSVLGELCNLVFETSEEDSTHVSEACPLLITLHRLPAILQYAHLLTALLPQDGIWGRQKPCRTQGRGQKEAEEGLDE